MTRRALSALLSVALLFMAAAAGAESVGKIKVNLDPPVAKYRGVAQVALSIRAEKSADAASIGRYAEGDYIYFSEYDPKWLTVIKQQKDGAWDYGYVLRHLVSSCETVQDGALPYGTTPAQYVATISKDTPLREKPGNSAAQIFQMKRGQRVAILEVKDGWAKVIYWRQYGYFYLDAVENMTPVYPLDTAGYEDTIAAFISFYRIDDEGLNTNRKSNIRQACEYISVLVHPGKTFDFDGTAGPYQKPRGYLEGMSFFEGQAVPSVGGGVCQVSSTMYNVLLALPAGITVTYRRPHGPSGATYLPHGVDAAVGSPTLNLVFRNDFAFPVRIEASAQDGVLFISMHKAG